MPTDTFWAVRVDEGRCGMLAEPSSLGVARTRTLVRRANEDGRVRRVGRQLLARHGGVDGSCIRAKVPLERRRAPKTHRSGRQHGDFESTEHQNERSIRMERRNTMRCTDFEIPSILHSLIGRDTCARGSCSTQIRVGLPSSQVLPMLPWPTTCRLEPAAT